MNDSELFADDLTVDEILKIDDCVNKFAGELAEMPYRAANGMVPLEESRKVLDNFVTTVSEPLKKSLRWCLEAEAEWYATWNQFVIERELGRGGMGVVYKARDAKHPGQLVALKVLHDIKRFSAEIQALTSLTHPNIVRLFSANGKPHFLVMEYIEGQTLEQKAAGLPCKPSEVVDWLIPVCKALAFAHQKGILHRDIKPANILLDVKGNPKLADFGLARSLKTPLYLTTVGNAVGTPAYMAPEQFRVDGTLSLATDIYAVGATLYELLTSRLPLIGNSDEETRNLVLTSDPVLVRELNPSVPKDLETVCMHCLEKNPCDRYQSAEELADDLQRIKENQRVGARPPGMVRHLKRWVSRHPSLAGAFIAAVPLLIGLGVVVGKLWSARSENRELEEAKQALQVSRIETERAVLPREIWQALEECDQGDRKQGVHRLARCLEHATHLGDADAERVVRINLASWIPFIDSPAERVDLIAPVRIKKWDVPTVKVLLISRNGRFVFGYLAEKLVVWSPDSWEVFGSPLPAELSGNAVVLANDGRVALEEILAQPQPPPITPRDNSDFSLEHPQEGNLWSVRYTVWDPAARQQKIGPGLKVSSVQKPSWVLATQEPRLFVSVTSPGNEGEPIFRSLDLTTGIPSLDAVSLPEDSSRSKKAEMLSFGPDAFPPNGNFLSPDGAWVVLRGIDTTTKRSSSNYVYPDLSAPEPRVANRRLEHGWSTRGGSGLRLWDVKTRYPLGPPLHDSYLPKEIVEDINTGRIRQDPWNVLFSSDGCFFSVIGMKETQTYAIPQPMQGSPEQLQLWLRLRTQAQLTPSGLQGVTDPAVLAVWRDKLAKLGEPTQPRK